MSKLSIDQNVVEQTDCDVHSTIAAPAKENLYDPVCVLCVGGLHVQTTSQNYAPKKGFGRRGSLNCSG